MTLWLKRLDGLAALSPRILLGPRGAETTESPIVLRPGGLGDMVLLTRAAVEAGIDLASICWVGERRNTQWTRYLGLPAYEYDSLSAFRRLLSGALRSRTVLNSEQTFGLAALFAARLTARGGRLIGYSINRRADLYETAVPYDLHAHELEMFRALLEAGGLTAAEVTGSDRMRPLPERAGAFQTDGGAIVALAGEEVEAKRLSVRAWRHLLRRGADRCGRVTLVGVEADRARADEIFRAGLGDRYENLVGRLSFNELVDRIRGAGRLLSVDSGLIHVADYCGVPSDAVFPHGNPAKWRPLHPECELLTGETARQFAEGNHVW